MKGVSSASKPIDSYKDELARNEKMLHNKYSKFEQQSRLQRRAFLDNDPQGGVAGITGLQTSDDKIIFAFYICYGIAIFTIVTVIVAMYKEKIGNTQSQIQIIMVAMAIAYGIAYYGISVHG